LNTVMSATLNPATIEPMAIGRIIARQKTWFQANEVVAKRIKIERPVLLAAPERVSAASLRAPGDGERVGL
jgi:hypothetical protein